MRCFRPLVASLRGAGWSASASISVRARSASAQPSSTAGHGVARLLHQAAEAAGFDVDAIGAGAEPGAARAGRQSERPVHDADDPGHRDLAPAPCAADARRSARAGSPAARCRAAAPGSPRGICAGSARPRRSPPSGSRRPDQHAPTGAAWHATHISLCWTASCGGFHLRLAVPPTRPDRFRSCAAIGARSRQMLVTAPIPVANPPRGSIVHAAWCTRRGREAEELR